jgi:hypothetical protein
MGVSRRTSAAATRPSARKRRTPDAANILSLTVDG